MYTHLSIVYNHDMAILRSLLLLLYLSLSFSRYLDEIAMYAGLVAGHYGGIVYFSNENIEYYHETKYSLKTTLIRNGLFASALALAASVFFFTSFSLMNRTAKAVLISKIATTICHIDHFIDGRQCVVLPTNNIQIL